MANTQPNIVFFFTDDQRFDTIRALGNDAIHTPALDALVARGTAFTNAYIMGGSCGAVCMPSRAMLHTGRTLYHLQEQGQAIPDTHVLLGEYLQTVGYRTFGTGKWHNGRRAYARSFTDGDDIFFGGMNDHWNVPCYHYDPTGGYETTLPYCPDAFHSNAVQFREADHITPGKHSSELFCDAAIDFIKRCDTNSPFFAYVSFMAPHDPRTMPREFLDMYDPDTIELPPNFMGGHPFDNGNLKGRDEELEDWPRRPEAIRKHLAEYYAMISHADANIRRVLDALEEKGIADNTIIVFAGDNGLALGQHGLMGKQSVYEHSVHVPLIFAGPGVPAGETRGGFCYLLDIFPTLCGLIGVDIPETVDGVNLVPDMRDGTHSSRDIALFAYREFQRSVRDDTYKLIEYAVHGRRMTQLFDLKADPFEINNLAGDPAYRDVLERMRKNLKRWRTEIGDDQQQGESFWSTVASE